MELWVSNHLLCMTKPGHIMQRDDQTCDVFIGEEFLPNYAGVLAVSDEDKKKTLEKLS